MESNHQKEWIKIAERKIPSAMPLSPNLVIQWHILFQKRKPATTHVRVGL